MTARGKPLRGPTRGLPPRGSVVHLIGIGGAGMSAIARVLRALGYVVRGSDLKESAVTARLRAVGVECFIGHDETNLGSCDAVVYSAAVKESNPELVAARRRGILTLTRSEALSYISSLKRTVSVAGTHGKTSTASMLALVLSEAGLDPSFMVGAELNEAGTNARWTQGEWLVLEADESDGTFLDLKTDVAVVTNVDRDHLENWGDSFDRLKDAFSDFMAGAGTAVVANLSDPVTARLCDRLVSDNLIRAPERPPRRAGEPSRTPSHLLGGAEGGLGPTLVGFGEGEEPGYSVTTLEVSEKGTLAEFRTPGGSLGEVRIPLIGRHFALNAAAVVAVADCMGVAFEEIRRGLEAFEGVERRMVYRGEARGVAVYDDYAHSPAEVAATVESGKELAAERGGRLICVFQPHLYSRTARYAAEFARALCRADVALVTDIYGAREDPIPGVSGRVIAEEALLQDLSARIRYAPSRKAMVDEVAAAARPADVVITMGAGDITAAVPMILEALAAGAGSGEDHR